MIARKTSRNIEDLDPVFQGKASVILDKGKHLGAFITDGARTFVDQDKLYSQGRTDKSKPLVTYAKGGESYHNYGLAVDIAFQVNGRLNYDTWRYEELYNKVEDSRIGVESLYRLTGFDRPHFQYANVTIDQLIRNKGLAMKEIPAQYKDGKTYIVQDGDERNRIYLIKDRKRIWANPDPETMFAHGLDPKRPDYFVPHSVQKDWATAPQLQFKDGYLINFFKSLDHHQNLGGDMKRAIRTV